jgi:ParB family chromosome partitioning protein
MPSKKTTGLGRGLGALIPQKPVVVGQETKGVERIVEKTVDSGRPLRLPVGEVHANPQQPRTVFSHAELEDLMNSIKEHGILQPIVVTPRPEGGYEIVAGERRFRAAKMLGLDVVPAVVRETDNQRDKLVLALIENVQREDLNPLEEARAYDRLSQEFGYTQEVIAQSVGKARSTVANAMRLLDLPTEIQEALAAGAVAAGSARAILALPDANQQMALFRKLVAKRLTSRETERAARRAGASTRQDPFLAAAEEELRNALGTRVEIKRHGHEGSIVVSFYSDEEMQGLLSRLRKC